MAMMLEKQIQILAAKANSRRKRQHKKRIRQIEAGVIPGRRKERKIQNWYTTRQLKEKVTAAFDRYEGLTGERKCRINGKYNLQVRGKHLRRLLKVMPNIKQKGRYLVES